jgi:hypothetical protein
LAPDNDGEDKERAWNEQINPMTGYAEGNFRGIQGAGNEQLVAARALKHGFIAFFKLWSDTKYDMVVDAEGVLFRVQIKGTSSESVAFKAPQRGGVQQPKKKPPRFYTREDCDVIVGVNALNGDCYVVPIDYATATGKASANFDDLENFRERWDFLSGNDYLSVEECRNGIGRSILRNRLAKILPKETLPSDLNELRVMFYENCPPPEED